MNDTCVPGPSGKAVWRDFLYSAGQLNGLIDAALQKQHHVSLSEYDVLENLAGAEDDTLQMSCVQALSTTSISGLSRTISRLEKKGLVEKRPSPVDKRAVTLVLTDAGRDLVPALRQTAEKLVHTHLLACLSLDEQATLARVTGTVACHIRGLDAGN